MVWRSFSYWRRLLGNSPASLVLGDNIFTVSTSAISLSGSIRTEGGTVFGYHVSPERFVVDFDASEALSIEEYLENRNQLRGNWLGAR